MPLHTPTHRHSGFLSVEIIAVLFVVISSLVLGSTWIQTSIDSRLNQATAEHAKMVAKATKTYIENNYSTVYAAANKRATYTLTSTPATIASQLPLYFQPITPYGHQYSIRVYRTMPDRLEVLIVTTGGDAVSDDNLRQIAQLIGAEGGYVLSNDKTRAQGAFGGWSIPFTSAGPPAVDYTPAPPENHGQLAMALFFEDGAVVSDYVYRNEVTGKPELNTMTTPLIMDAEKNANDPCTSTGAIARSNTGALLSCQGGTWKPASGSLYWKDPVATHSALPWCNPVIEGQTHVVTTPTVGTGARAHTCRNGNWEALAVDDNGDLTVPGKVTSGRVESTAGATGSASSTFYDMAGSRIAANTSIYSYGRICSQNGSGDCTGAGGTVIDGGNISSAGTIAGAMLRSTGQIQIDGVVTEGAFCAVNGLVGRNANGLLLSCQSGVWASQGGKLNIIYTKTGSTKDSGTISFTLTSTGIVSASISSHELAGTHVYALVYLNGTLCARDRDILGDSTSNKYASATCTRMLNAGTHTVRTAATADDAFWWIDVGQF